MISRAYAHGTGCGPRPLSTRTGSTAIATFAVLTSSDRGAGNYPGWKDLGGDAVVETLTAAGHVLHERKVVADDATLIGGILTAWCDSRAIDLVFTTGGTGLGPRDVTPEATGAVIEYDVPGIAEAMRAYSLTKTPMGMLSRARAGVRGRALVINLPGNPRGVRECLEVVLPVLAHAIEILKDRHSGPHPR